MRSSQIHYLSQSRNLGSAEQLRQSWSSQAQAPLNVSKASPCDPVSAPSADSTLQKVLLITGTQPLLDP